MNNDFEMTLVDSHCHLNSELYGDQLENVIVESKRRNLKWIVNLGYSDKSNEEVIKIGEREKERRFLTAVGIHPDEEKDFTKENLLKIENWAREGKIVAVGEIGLDYSRNKTVEEKERQKSFFEKQIRIAIQFNLPILVHIREAFEDTREIIERSGIRIGIIHCFTGNYQIAKWFTKLGFLISFSGIITFKNNQLEEAVGKIPLENLMIETDSPYLTPEPLRGKKNYPWNVIHTIERVCSIREESAKKISEQMIKNVEKLFRIN